jgi:hypothetical protein
LQQFWGGSVELAGEGEYTRVDGHAVYFTKDHPLPPPPKHPFYGGEIRRAEGLRYNDLLPILLALIFCIYNNMTTLMMEAI